MNNFHSNAEEIRFLIKQLLDEGQEKTTQEIIQYVKATSGKEFTGGMLSGAINDFIDREKKEYRRIRRGVYAKVTQTYENNSEDAFDLIIKNAIAEVEEARRVDIENLTVENLPKMQEKAREIITVLQGLLNS